MREKDQKGNEFMVHQKEEIQKLLEEYKGTTSKKNKAKNDPLAIELNNYIFSEEKKEENEWENLVLYFKD